MNQHARTLIGRRIKFLRQSKDANYSSIRELRLLGKQLPNSSRPKLEPAEDWQRECIHPYDVAFHKHVLHGDGDAYWGTIDKVSNVPISRRRPAWTTHIVYYSK